MVAAVTEREDLDELLGQVDMESYLDSEGIEYKRTHGSRGTQLNLQTCPKCGTSKWKVFLNAETGLGNCFSGSCEAKFNKYSFVMAHIDGGHKETIEHLKMVALASGWKPKRKYVVPTKDFSKLQLPASWELPYMGRTLKYLADRGIDERTQRYFGLRFCDKGYFKYEFEGQEKFMPFSKRILIPVFDLDGQMVSFQGRDITGTAEKKYLFPPGFAATGEQLFNGHNALGRERVVMGEGAFDVMAIKIAFWDDPVLRLVEPIGSFGKHLSFGSESSQLGKFAKLRAEGLKEVTFMWDAEPAALSAALDASKHLAGLGLTVRIAVLPKGKDPNEVPAETVRQCYLKALPLTQSNILKLRLKTI